MWTLRDTYRESAKFIVVFYQKNHLFKFFTQIFNNFGVFNNFWKKFMLIYYSYDNNLRFTNKRNLN